MPTIRVRNGKFQAQVRIKVDGVIVHQESATFAKEKQAMTWGLKLEEKIEKDGFAARKQDTTTVADLMDMHEAYLTKLGKTTLALSGRYKNLKKAEFIDKPASKVTSADIIEWASGFRAGRSPATVLIHLMGLSALFRAGPVAHGVKSDVREVAAAISHLKQLQVASVSNERERRVTDAEIQAIADYHFGLCNPAIPLGDIMRLMVALPRRRGEFMKALWVNYDPKASTLKLVDTKNPTKLRTEVVPVPPLAKAILDRLPRTDERILPYNPSSVSTAIYRACKMTGIDNLHLHDLRHEGISRLFSLGLSIQHVAMISGHLSWQTLRRYTHLTTKDVLDQF